MKGKHLENSGVPASRLAESIMVPIWYAEMQLLNPPFVLQATCSSKPEGKHGAHQKAEQLSAPCHKEQCEPAFQHPEFSLEQKARYWRKEILERSSWWQRHFIHVATALCYYGHWCRGKTHQDIVWFSIQAAFEYWRNGHLPAFAIEGWCTVTLSKLVLYALSLYVMGFCSILEIWKLTKITPTILEMSICKHAYGAPNTQVSSRATYLNEAENSLKKRVCCEVATCIKANRRRGWHMSRLRLCVKGCKSSASSPTETCRYLVLQLAAAPKQNSWGRLSQPAGGHCPLLSWLQPLLGGTDNWCPEARIAKKMMKSTSQPQCGPTRTQRCPHRAQHTVHELHHCPQYVEESLIYLPPVLFPINLKSGLNADCIPCFCTACICTVRPHQHKGFPVATGVGSGYMALPQDGSKLGRGTENAVLFWELLQGAGWEAVARQEPRVTFVCLSLSIPW